MREENRRGAALVAAMPLAAVMALWSASGPEVERWRAVEVAAAANDADEALLGRPLGLACDGGLLYVCDAQDCAVKVFAADGRFLRTVGRKGAGPGDLNFPSGVSVRGGLIYVADKSNSRVQVFDKEGRARGGFALPFRPDRVLALSDATLLVTSNPTGRGAAEKLLHLYDETGRLRWEGLEAFASSDRIYDAFRNMIVVCAGADGDFYVVFRSGRRDVLHFAASGALAETIPVDERHAFLPLDLPFAGPNKRLLGFCWAADRDGGFLYISAPEPVDGRDLGPGRRLSVIEGSGRIAATVDLPCPVHRFAVEGRRVYAVDEDGGLRIFEVVR
jgi:hypothetical protein